MNIPLQFSALNWNDLRYFLVLTREGTLASTARTLAVDQTTVGRRIHALEAALKTRLFDRARDGFVATLAGEQLVAQAQAIEASVFELERRVSGQDQRVVGEVRLATSENLAVSFFLRHLGRLHRLHPGITLEVTTGIGFVNLLRREADLAVRAGSRPSQKDLVARKLGVVGLGIYGSAGYLKGKKRADIERDLDGHEVIGFADEMASSAPAEWLADHSQRARVTFRGGSFECLAEACAAGWGLALLPHFVGEMHSGLRRAIKATALTVDIWMVVHPDLARTGRVRAVMDALTQLFVDRSRTLTEGRNA